MRRTKLYQLLAVAGGLGVAVASTSVWAGGPNMDCSEVLDSSGNPMSLMDKFEWSGGSYSHEKGMGAIDISGDATEGGWSIADIFKGIVDVDAVILKGSTGTYVYYYEPGAKISDVFSKLDLPLNNGGQYPDISNIQFCEDGHKSSDGGNPNMSCSEITADNGTQMSLVDKFEWSGSSYSHESGTGTIDITGDATGGSWKLNKNGEIVDVDAVIIKGATGTYVYNYEPGAKISDAFSKLDLPLNNGGQYPDISNIQFCEDGEFASKDAEVCLWMADKDKDDNYINIEQVGCIGAEKGKFYAIEAGGEFSSVLEAE